MMSNPSTTDPDYPFTEIFHWFLNRWNELEAFRRIAETSYDAALDIFYQEHQNLIYALQNNPDYMKFVNQEKFADAMNDPTKRKKLLSDMFQRQSKTFKSHIDVASLIIAHNILEHGLMDFIRLSAKLDRPSWKELLLKKQINLADALGSPLEELVTRLIEKQISSEIDNYPLIKKIFFLFDLCPPVDPSEPGGYLFNKDQIEEIDELRHTCAHGKFRPDTPSINEHLKYIEGTFLHLFARFSEKYGVKVNATYSTEIVLSMDGAKNNR